MQLEQYHYGKNGWNQPLNRTLDSENTLILIFSSPNISLIKEPLSQLKIFFPKSKIMGCSSAGEIYKSLLATERFVVQVLKFEKTQIKLVHHKIEESKYSKDVGKALALELGSPQAIFLLSDGLNVNGSQLTKGISKQFNNETIISGGLAGDDANFEETWVLVDREPKSHYVSAVGFYGQDLYFNAGSAGGWKSMGLKREVTNSCDNILYELDNQPALELYKKYLGERAGGLPSTGLLFPLGINGRKDEICVRTILGVNEETQSMTFAGDIPQGSTVTLMKSTFQSLIDGASKAVNSMEMESPQPIDSLLCVSISCVGRKMVLGQRVEDEIEAVMDALPQGTMQVGYYSYGEISPRSSGRCDLYNQTMTVTLIGEL